MRKSAKLFLFSLLAAALAAAIAEGIALSKARKENSALADQLEGTEQTFERETRRDSGAGPTLELQNTEILKLRNEVAQLRRLKRELERLRNENAQLRALLDAEKSSTTSQWTQWLATLRTNLINPTDVQSLLTALTNDATAVRLQAACVLRNIGLRRMLDTNLTSAAEAELREEARTAVPGLISALKDPDTMVRANAAITLGFLGESDQVVPALIACLDDQEDRVATGAAKALGRLQSGATSAIPALLQVAQSSNQWRRESAINAIKQIDPDAAKAAGLQ
jgi:HEAT repeat protein